MRNKVNSSKFLFIIRKHKETFTITGSISIIKLLVFPFIYHFLKIKELVIFIKCSPDVLLYQTILPFGIE